MRKLEKMRCGECGKRGLIKLKSVKGQSMPYKHYEKVTVKVDWLFLPTCKCGNMLLRMGDSAALDLAIEQSLKK